MGQTRTSSAAEQYRQFRGSSVVAHVAHVAAAPREAAAISSWLRRTPQVVQSFVLARAVCAAVPPSSTLSAALALRMMLLCQTTSLLDTALALMRERSWWS